MVPTHGWGQGHPLKPEAKNLESTEFPRPVQLGGSLWACRGSSSLRDHLPPHPGPTHSPLKGVQGYIAAHEHQQQYLNKKRVTFSVKGTRLAMDRKAKGLGGQAARAPRPALPRPSCAPLG